MTSTDLKELQALSLSEKIKLTNGKIIEWYDAHNGKVAISFSGGKDSTVLLKLVRELYPEVPAVYCDVGINCPEVDAHVAATSNVTVIKPALSYREIISEYGFCYPSKEIAEIVEGVRRGVPSLCAKIQGKKLTGDDYPYYQRFKKWRWLVDVPIKISARCCEVIKKQPMREYTKVTGRKVIIGTMADESAMRRTAFKKAGCNNYKTGKSTPLGFWTQQDVLRYIVENEVKIPAVYGDIVEDKRGKLRCTGVNRTGCVFCPIGCHETPNKFQRMKETNPALYKRVMELGLHEFLTTVGVDH